MSAEIATLTRKVDAVSAKVDLALAQLAALNRSGKPGMSQNAFAKLIGRHPRTVSRMVADKRIRLEKGLIPNSEVRKFLS